MNCGDTRTEWMDYLTEADRDPRVRRVRSALVGLGVYPCFESTDDYEWATSDAARFTEAIDEGRSLLDEMSDAGFWCPPDPEPTRAIAAIHAALEGEAR